MEPMTLGSPSGTGIASAGSAGYLPSFLMGDPPTTPRPNTLSPTRGRTSLAYSHGVPGMAGSPSEGFRSPPMLQQSHHQNQYSSPFMLPHTPQGQQQQQQQQPHAQRFLQNSSAHASSLANQYHRNESFDANSSTAGPPTQGLFDSWRKEKQLLPASSRGPIVPDVGGLSFNESLQNQSGFNVSRAMSPIPHSTDFNRTANVPLSPSPPYDGGQQEQQEHSNWVTVYGFPQNAISIIMAHFMGVGTILEKQPALQGGNWVHLRYSSRIECNRAVNYNGRIISPGLMIGVQYCNDAAVTGKENDGEAAPERPQKSFSRVRSLMDVSYTAKQQENAVTASPIAQKRTNGIVNKAMDLFFGW